MRKKITFQILAVFYNTDSASAGLYILEYQFRKYFYFTEGYISDTVPQKRR